MIGCAAKCMDDRRKGGSIRSSSLMGEINDRIHILERWAGINPYKDTNPQKRRSSMHRKSRNNHPDRILAAEDVIAPGL